MKVLTTIDSLRAHVINLKHEGHSLALVPTMGALHEGHASLVKIAHQHAKRVMVSIFVNPSQFNEKRDFDLYPRELEKDITLLSNYGVESIFAPSSPEILYGEGFQTWIVNDHLSSRYEGASRPGHFKGVATIVSILFNAVRPDSVVFGEKDFQQLRIVEKLVEDLKFPLQVVRAPLIREEGGLALSSRNVRLSSEGRISARALSRSLFVARDAFVGGERRARNLKELVLQVCSDQPGVSLDYAVVVNERSLEEVEIVTDPSRILLAASVEGVRLIDNMALSPSSILRSSTLVPSRGGIHS